MLGIGPLFDGASGETRREIAHALGMDDPVVNAAQDFLAYSKSLFRRTENELPIPVEAAITSLKSALDLRSEGVKLTAANSLWYDQRAPVDPAYAAAVRENYDADVFQVDFVSPDTPRRVNDWVSQKTAGNIRQIATNLDPNTVLVSVNGIYFNGLWYKSFNKELTRDQPFTNGQGEQRLLPAMAQTGEYLYYEDPGFQAVRLPYKDHRVVMYVFLPTRNSSLQEFRRKLDANSWRQWLGAFKIRQGSIRQPRVKLSFSTDLRIPLSALGMKRAFDRGRAEFGGIRKEPGTIWVDDVIHRAVVEVNEEGTEAAAATIRVILSAPVRERRLLPFEMIVDRPFLFLISRGEDGRILFVGSVSDPLPR